MTQRIWIDQASAKWCPFARIAHQECIWRPDGSSDQVVTTANRMAAGVLYGTNCLTTGCMAWVPDPEQPDYGRCGLVK